MLDLFKTELVKITELQRVKANFVSNLIFSQDDLIGQAHMMGLLEMSGLDFRLIDQLP